MIRFLIHVAIFLATAALGLLVASWILTDFRISISGFIWAVIIFAVAQSVLSPFIFKLANRYASALLGGIGLVSTFVALLVTSILSGGLEIRGIVTWVLATLIVWLVSALGTWLLPLIFLKNRDGEKRRQASVA